MAINEIQALIFSVQLVEINILWYLLKLFQFLCSFCFVEYANEIKCGILYGMAYINIRYGKTNISIKQMQNAVALTLILLIYDKRPFLRSLFIYYSRSQLTITLYTFLNFRHARL